MNARGLPNQCLQQKTGGKKAGNGKAGAGQVKAVSPLLEGGHHAKELI